MREVAEGRVDSDRRAWLWVHCALEEVASAPAAVHHGQVRPHGAARTVERHGVVPQHGAAGHHPAGAPRPGRGGGSAAQNVAGGSHTVGGAAGTPEAVVAHRCTALPAEAPHAVA